jgi:hypothetical protein
MPPSGSCLCGQIRYDVSGPLRPVVYCHCTQCRKQSGHFVAATSAADGDLSVDGAEKLRWYAATVSAKRGFCSNCGSLLFWKANGSAKTSIMAGGFDDPTGIGEGHHIFCADKGDYYEIDGGLPQYPASD